MMFLRAFSIESKASAGCCPLRRHWIGHEKAQKCLSLEGGGVGNNVCFENRHLNKGCLMSRVYIYILYIYICLYRYM